MTPDPPVIYTISPTIVRPLSLTITTAIFAISSGIANLPNGIFALYISLLFETSVIIGVNVGPGAIPLTIIPCGTNDFAKPKVNPLIPHFDMLKLLVLRFHHSKQL